MAEIAKWSISGEVLPFQVFGLHEDWNPVPALYMWCFLYNNYWCAVYAGKTESLQSRLPNHERMLEAIAQGATHTHVLVVKDSSERDRLERMLIANLQPPLNIQHRRVI